MQVMVLHRDEGIQAALRMTLRNAGFDVCGSASKWVSVQLAAQIDPDIILVDLLAVAQPGVPAFHTARRMFPAACLVALRPSDEFSTVGFEASLTVPFSDERLLQTLREVAVLAATDIPEADPDSVRQVG